RTSELPRLPSPALARRLQPRRRDDPPVRRDAPGPWLHGGGPNQRRRGVRRDPVPGPPAQTPPDPPSPPLNPRGARDGERHGCDGTGGRGDDPPEDLRRPLPPRRV